MILKGNQRGNPSICFTLNPSYSRNVCVDSCVRLKVL